MGDLKGEKNEKKRKLKELLNEVSDRSLNITNNIMDLQRKLFERNEQYPQELRGNKRRKLNTSDSSANNGEDTNGKNENVDYEELWNELNKDWTAFLPECNKTMDIWDKKMKLVQTYSEKKAKKKHKDEHSILERLALVIDNPQRILMKMQSVDKLFKMYGDKDIKINNEGNVIENEEDENINKKDERILNNEEGLKFEKYRMEYEVFNDSQVYRRLLKEIIDIGHAASFNADELHRKMDNIQQEKQRQKLAFHKAKLRMKYTIRPDMENFMAPIYNHDADFPVEQLYNSLFQ